MSGEKTSIDVTPIPALSDNYMYVFRAQDTKNCCVVDPVEPKKVKNFLDSHGLYLTEAFITHHHWDHAGGNKELVHLYPNVRVYGADERIDCMNVKVNLNQPMTIGSLTITPLFTPCHTRGHVCYFVQEGSKVPVVFSGDTLFVGGCGRFFEGTAQQMYQALVQILGRLPNETKVYCGHEYTVKNLQFALTVDGTNKAISEKLKWAEGARKSGHYTIPSTIGDEWQTNVFMRVEQLQPSLGCSSPHETMAKLRALKDHF